MSSNPASAKAHPLSQVLAWAALLVLTLGLPRLFVICVGPHGGAHVEVVHASGACCAHDAERRAPADVDGDAIDDDHRGCTDVALGLGTAPLPKAVSVDLEQQSYAMVFGFDVTDDRPDTTAGLRPPSTGPPRPDRRTLLLASTVLLL